MEAGQKKDTGMIRGCVATVLITGESLVREGGGLAGSAGMYMDRFVDKNTDPLSFLVYVGAYTTLLASPIIVGYSADRYGGRVKELAYMAGGRLKALFKG